MRESEFDIALGLIIRTEESVDFISSIMEIEPSKVMQPNLKLDDYEEEKNVWVYRKKYANCTDVGLSIGNFINGIENFTDKIARIKKYGVCVIRMSVVSTYGQFGFSFAEKDLSLLNEQKIPLEMTFFSYGNCIDE